jgi:hypothetical protein
LLGKDIPPHLKMNEKKKVITPKRAEAILAGLRSEYAEARE